MTPHGAASASALEKTVPDTSTTSRAIVRQRARLRGFTLVAGVRATASLTRNSERQSDQLLAQLCAENALISVRLSQQMPAVGDNTTACEQAGRSLAVKLSVQPTPNPNFLRVEAQVSDGQAQLLTLSTVVGRY
jgi:general secretion pathway protein I